MRVVDAASRRTSTTPNATMTTLASPTLGGSSASLWLVEMGPGAAGPVHAFAREVIWAITDGSAELRVGDDVRVLRAGDTAVLAGGVLRRLSAGADGFRAVVTATPSEVTRDDGTSAGVPDWVA